MQEARSSQTAARPHEMLFSLLYCIGAALVNMLTYSLYIALPHRWRGIRLDAEAACEYFEGFVTHTRSKPQCRSFRYRVRYCLIDLEKARLPACCRSQLDDRLTAAQARSFTGCAGDVQLLLLPKSASFEENPIAVYYCHNKEGDLQCCIAEVTNTPWGDRVRFVFDPNGDEVPKPMHVSPFQDMESSWKIQGKCCKPVVLPTMGYSPLMLTAMFIFLSTRIGLRPQQIIQGHLSPFLSSVAILVWELFFARRLKRRRSRHHATLSDGHGSCLNALRFGFIGMQLACYTVGPRFILTQERVARVRTRSAHAGEPRAWVAVSARQPAYRACSKACIRSTAMNTVSRDTLRIRRGRTHFGGETQRNTPGDK